MVGNVITALTSNAMIAPSYWVDPKSGNDYLLTVQYPEDYIHNLADLRAVPLRGPNAGQATQLDTVSSIRHIESPTEVDHYQLRREMDVYVSPAGEDLSGVLRGVEHIIQGINLPEGVRVKIRGSVQAMQHLLHRLRLWSDSCDACWCTSSWSLSSSRFLIRC